MKLIEWARLPESKRPEIRSPRHTTLNALFGRTEFFNDDAVRISDNKKMVYVRYRASGMAWPQYGWLRADTEVEAIE